MAPDGLMIGAQGPASHISLLGKGVLRAAEGSQLPGGEERRWALGLSRVIRTTGQDTASTLSVCSSLSAASLTFPGQRWQVCNHLLSWKKKIKLLQTLSIVGKIMVCVMGHQVMSGSTLRVLMR